MSANRSDYQKTYRQKYKRHTKRVMLTFSREEYDELVRQMGEGKMATVLRARVLSEALKSDVRAGMSAEGKEIAQEVVFLLRNMANNINQMAYHSNRLRQVLDENEPLLALQRLG